MTGALRNGKNMSSLFKSKWFVTATTLGALSVVGGACSQQSSDPPANQGGTSPGAAGTLGAAGSAVGVGGASSGGSTPIGTGTAGSTPINPGTGGIGSGTGGAVGVAGTSPGSSGSGGAAAVKLCATKVTAASTQIADFENYNGTTTIDKYGFAFGGPTNGTAGVYSGPYAYAGGTDVPVLAIRAGHAGNYGLTLDTTPATAWGQGLGFWMGCVNASAYKGITFWVRGDVPSGVFSFAVNMESTTVPDANNVAGGGTCPGTADTCKAPTKSAIPIGIDWSQVSVPWADLTGGLSGTAPVVASGDTITGFTLQMALNYAGNDDAGYAPVSGNISFAIDDIAFMP